MGSIRCNETSKIVQAQGHGIQSNQSKGMAGTSGTGDRKYDWQSDAKACYEYALRMIALRIGSRQFQSLPEMYWQEQHGNIP
jgi:hypothetical protein